MAAGLAQSQGRRSAASTTCSTRSAPDGGWDEPEFTGTGFPRVFYLRYHYYPIYFPLMALAELRSRRTCKSSEFKVQRFASCDCVSSIFTSEF